MTASAAALFGHQASRDFDHELIRARQPEAVFLHLAPSGLVDRLEPLGRVAQRFSGTRLASAFPGLFWVVFEGAAQFKHGGGCNGRDIAQIPIMAKHEFTGAPVRGAKAVEIVTRPP